MKNMRLEKTNAMRILDGMGVAYEALQYASDGTAKDAGTVAQILGEPESQVYKTLVTLDDKGAPHVCVLSAESELDLKKAAAHFGVKSLQMERVKDLKALTGYVRGGCSPVGMKKSFPTVVDEAARALPYILVSAGKIGVQLKLFPLDLCRACGASFAKISR